jgi:type I restriction-modification system DNA methylase subunit
MQHFCIEESYQDLLGPVYMEIGSRWTQAGLGQYFTPWAVCICMARMNACDHDWDEKPYPSVCDPCVGSGAMLLAFRAVVAEEKGREWASKLRLHGSDIDEVCVSMAKVQLYLTDDLYMRDFMLALAGVIERVA